MRFLSRTFIVWILFCLDCFMHLFIFYLELFFMSAYVAWDLYSVVSLRLNKRASARGIIVWTLSDVCKFPFPLQNITKQFLSAFSALNRFIVTLPRCSRFQIPMDKKFSLSELCLAFSIYCWELFCIGKFAVCIETFSIKTNKFIYCLCFALLTHPKIAEY